MRATWWALLFALGCSEPPRPAKVAEAPASGGARAAAPSPSFPYPPTPISPAFDVLHGVRVSDPYRWLEDGASKDVARWAEAQDSFARARLDALPLVEPLRRRFRELYYVADREPSFRRGAHYFWGEREKTQEKAVVRVRKGANGEPRTLLDPNSWSADGSLSLGGWSVSRSGRYVAYQVSRNAADEASLHFVEVETGRELSADTIEGAKYSWEVGWSLNDDGVYYTWVPPPGAVSTADRPGHAEIRFHRFGTSPADDPTIWAKTGDPTSFVTASTDWDDDPYLYYVVRHGWTSEDVRILDLRSPKARWQELAVGRKANFATFYFSGKFYVRTDEGALRGRVFAVDPRKLERKDWVEIVPEHPTRALEWARPIGNRLVLGYLDDVKSRIEVRDFNGRLERELVLPGLGSAQLAGHPKDDLATLEFTTFTQPPQLYRESVSRGERSLDYQVEVPFDPSPFVVDQIFARSKDGTRVPAFLVRRKAGAGPAPVLLYGYGGYAASLTPEFWGSIVPWLEHGGVAAFANLRGGAEYGEAWHQAGMLHRKQNVFDDFSAVAEHLIATGVTRPELLAIRGDSNGGLLVGAALTQRPELYRVALCGVPLLDMVRYHRFGSGKTWIEEMGDPDVEADFRALFAYSPYHHVVEGVRYPSLLLQSASDDDRVDPMHARKFAAIMQARSRGGIVLLRIEGNAGHGGGDSIKSLVDQRAHAFAFAMSEVGMN